MLGVGTAHVLAERGVEVVVVEPGAELAAELGVRPRWQYVANLRARTNVTILLGTTVEELDADGALAATRREKRSSFATSISSYRPGRWCRSATLGDALKALRRRTGGLRRSATAACRGRRSRPCRRRRRSAIASDRRAPSSPTWPVSTHDTVGCLEPGLSLVDTLSISGSDPLRGGWKTTPSTPVGGCAGSRSPFGSQARRRASRRGRSAPASPGRTAHRISPPAGPSAPRAFPSGTARGCAPAGACRWTSSARHGTRPAGRRPP